MPRSLSISRRKAHSPKLKSTLDVLRDPDLMRQIRASERYLAKGGKGLSFEEVFGVPLRPPGKRARS